MYYIGVRCTPIWSKAIWPKAIWPKVIWAKNHLLDEKSMLAENIMYSFGQIAFEIVMTNNWFFDQMYFRPTLIFRRVGDFSARLSFGGIAFGHIAFGHIVSAKMLSAKLPRTRCIITALIVHKPNRQFCYDDFLSSIGILEETNSKAGWQGVSGLEALSFLLFN